MKGYVIKNGEEYWGVDPIDQQKRWVTNFDDANVYDYKSACDEFKIATRSEGMSDDNPDFIFAEIVKRKDEAKFREENYNISLLQALVNLHKFNCKTGSAAFTIRFKEFNRVAIVSKYWDRDRKEFRYSVEETNAPGVSYNEEQIIGAIAQISGITLHFNSVRTLPIDKLEYT